MLISLVIFIVVVVVVAHSPAVSPLYGSFIFSHGSEGTLCRFLKLFFCTASLSPAFYCEVSKPLSLFKLCSLSQWDSHALCRAPPLCCSLQKAQSWSCRRAHLICFHSPALHVAQCLQTIILYILYHILVYCVSYSVMNEGGHKYLLYV